MNRRWALLLAPLLLLAMLLNLALYPAQAAQLPISGAKITTVAAAGRCTQAVTVTPGTITGSTASKVTVSGLANCGGRLLALTLFSKGGTAIPKETVTLVPNASDSVTVTVPEYSPAAVTGAAVTVGSWGVPAKWTYTSPVDLPLVSCRVISDESKTCTARKAGFDSWWGDVHTAYYLQFVVGSGSLSRDDEWEITINLAHPDLRLIATHIRSGANVVVAGWSCSPVPLLVLRGKGESRFVGDWLEAYVELWGTSVGPGEPADIYTCP